MLMLIATWILAISTAVLAIGGPITYMSWRNERKQERRRHELEQEQEARDQILKSARDEFVPKSWVSGVAAIGAIIGVLGALSWFDGKRPKS
jgi:hypothetical protein